MATSVEGLPRVSPIARPLGRLRRSWVAAGHARPGGYVALAGTIAVLNMVGLVMVLSASSVSSLSNYGSAWVFFERQLIWIALGALAFLVAARFDYHHWRRLVTPLLLVSGVLLTLVLVPHVGILVYGSRRWLGSGFLRFQPSEVAKLALLVFVADVMTRRTGGVHDWRQALRPVILVFFVFALLVMKEPDMASTMVLALIVAAGLVVGGVRRRHLVTLFGAGLAAASVLAIAEPYRRDRVFSFLDPIHDKSNTGYQLTQSLIALGSGGWTGVGLGAGRAKWLFLPNAHTDFIFAIIGEELGLLGCFLVVGLFVAFAVLGIRAALRAPDRFGTLLAAGVTVWIVGQAVINISAVIGLLPVSGVPLPFVSFGGSALVFSMVAAGILGNVARQGRVTARA
ncbi:MAG: putative lipid II flippase FtsW [Acidimicrobiia bacterium]